ncbi:MAG: hypothetical protein RBT19_05025 [Tenuifilaceae bacterium]|jgi:hypothetical protein|uniref:hypothetical protein n=1 Tax=Perlabentimonas gracilis TaxID=2715279 RepID=UPI001C63B399|nr:hypothetical protein [Perlabentimonas gracilis]MDX9769702.1 hypothetical protein [Tenuifilaceae bacterium]
MKTMYSKALLTKTLASLLGAAVVVVMVSCGGGAKQAETDKTVESKEEAFKSVTNYPIPTAFEVVKLLNKAGASYILSLNNPVENVDKYFTEKSKALNLGVYGANLSYASTYQMKQETMSYLNVSKKLIEDLQITSAFNKDFADRVEGNLDNKDELIQIITDSFYDTYEFLVNEGKDNISLLVMTGSWLEGLYITTQIAMVSKNNEDILKIIANQKDPINKLFELMEPVTDDAAVAEVMEMLKPLKALFDGVEGETITPEQFEKIEQEINKVRTAIVS